MTAYTTTGLGEAILAYLRAREKRAAIEWELHQARADVRRLFADVRRLPLDPDAPKLDGPHAAFFNAREKRADLESALQQARARESQLSADVRRLAPGPGMYRVGDDYVLVTHDEVYPAAAPVEVSS